MSSHDPTTYADLSQGKIIEELKPGEPGSNTRFWLAWKVGLYNGSGSAGIYAVATKTEARGLGIASLLTNVAMQAAKEMGQKLCVLDSSPPAEKLYRRLGFHNFAEFKLYSSIAGVV